MEQVYVEAEACEGGLVHCGLNTAVISFAAVYLECDRLRINLVKSQNGSSSCWITQTGLYNECVLDNTHVPHLVQQCSLPAMLTDGDYMARAGLCSVLRQMVKIAHRTEPSREWSKLLGFKGICLKACAEVSAWTKFCEIELPKAIKRALRQTSLPRSESALELPLELCKLEHHLTEPAIIPNIAKKRQEALKKLKKVSPAEEFQKLSLTQNAFQSCNENLPGMQHLYAEGTELTLTDLILFPPISLFLSCHKDKISAIAEKIPLVVQWYRRLLNDRDVQDAAHCCRISTIDTVNADSVPLKDLWSGTVMQPSVPSSMLNLRDLSKKKCKANMSLVGAVMEKLESSGVHPVSEEHPCKGDIQLPWESLPAALNPSGGDLPIQRVKRKCQQLENLVSAVTSLARPGQVIVDFCSGGGHLGLVLAHCLPQCKVVLVENKEESICRARGRIEKLGLNNITLYQCNLDYFRGHFDVGICLHACGVATDLVLQCCLDNQAAFVICPCCYGSIQNTHTVTYPRSDKFKNSGITSQECIMLGHAADQTQVSIPQAETGKACMMLVDMDRASLARQHGYEVTLCTLQPPSCSPKNNLLIGNSPINNSVTHTDIH